MNFVNNIKTPSKVSQPMSIRCLPSSLLTFLSSSHPAQHHCHSLLSYTVIQSNPPEKTGACQLPHFLSHLVSSLSLQMWCHTKATSNMQDPANGRHTPLPLSEGCGRGNPTQQRPPVLEWGQLYILINLYASLRWPPTFFKKILF